MITICWHNRNKPRLSLNNQLCAFRSKTSLYSRSVKLNKFSSFEGWYDIPEGMVFNVPARILSNGEYVVVPDLELSEESAAKIQESVDVCIYNNFLFAKTFQIA